MKGAGVLSDGVITLRPLTAEDTERILRWRNSERVRSHFIFREELTREAHEEWLRTRVQTGEVLQYIICMPQGEAKEARPVGSVYLRDVNREERKAEFGIFIGEEDALGKGCGTRATRLILQHAFAELSLSCVYLRAYCDNRAALDSYLRAGFKIVRTLKDVESTDGEIADMYLMEALHA
ncbi:MAG: GNAT family N-acetyltransferase [Lachnospiraceae bacterium]|nr:GNAT family N-acetyltransferase [Lachnospiraceae bacterium]